jgi:hypothetical protein
MAKHEWQAGQCTLNAIPKCGECINCSGYVWNVSLFELKEKRIVGRTEELKNLTLPAVS